MFPQLPRMSWERGPTEKHSLLFKGQNFINWSKYDSVVKILFDGQIIVKW